MSIRLIYFLKKEGKNVKIKVMRVLIPLIIVLVIALGFMVWNVFKILEEWRSIEINLEEIEYPWEKTDSQLPIYKEWEGKG